MQMNKRASKKVFVLLPFDPHSHDVLQAIRDACGDASFNLDIELIPESEWDRRPVPGEFEIVEIREELRSANLVIGVLTGAQQSILWALGFAEGLGKPLILLSGEVPVPFIAREQRIVVYRPERQSYEFLRSRLGELLTETVKDLEEGYVAPARSVPTPKRVFFSYSHEDAPYLNRILVHLRPLERSGAVDLWSDLKIAAGDRWRIEIANALEQARTAVLLISADFLASEFIINDELPALLAAAEERGTRIVPIILKPSRFARDTRLSHYQALNKFSEPVIKMEEVEREELYARLAELIELDLG